MECPVCQICCPRGSSTQFLKCLMDGTGPGEALQTQLASLPDPQYFVLGNLKKATVSEQGFSCSSGVVRTLVAGRGQTPGRCNRQALLSWSLTHRFHTFQLPREQRRGVLRQQFSSVGSPETQHEVGPRGRGSLVLDSSSCGLELLFPVSLLLSKAHLRGGLAERNQANPPWFFC